MIRLLFLSLFLIGEVSGDCNCNVQLGTQTYDPAGWSTFWLQNEYDGNDPCIPTNYSCAILLIVGPTQGIGLYKQLRWDDGVEGVINLYNSNSTRGKVSKLMENIRKDDPRPPATSTGQYVLVEMALTTAGYVLATMEMVDTPATVAPPVITTVPAITTPAYNGTMSVNPALISNDLLIMVDQGQTNNITDFANSKAFAAALVNKIAPSVFGGEADNSPVTGTRLALNYLNYINYGSAVTPWVDNSTLIATQITSLPSLQSKKTDFYSALNALISNSQSIFNPANTQNADMNSRNTAQRVLIVVASSPPDENDKIYSTEISFGTYDIHPIFVAYNFDTSLVALESMGFQVEGVTDTSDDTVNAFVEKYMLANSGSTLCKGPGNLKFTVNDDESNSTVINYGFDHAPTDKFYTPDYSKNRYCNFQKISYTVTKPTTGRGYCFKVFFELEVEKDTLKFYQCNDEGIDCIEYVSLSGTDVSGSTFCFTRNARIDFFSNESGVYGGYYITFTKTT